MDATTNLLLPYIAAQQAQKHVTVNETFRRLDALVQTAVVSATTTAQPGAPSDGDVDILPVGKTGAAWGPMSNLALAYYVDGAWMQISPREGFRAWVKDTDTFVLYNGSTWSTLSGGGGGGGGREALTANRTYFVRTNGSDSNNGLADTAGGAFLTWQKAVDVAAGLETVIYDVTIRCTQSSVSFDVGTGIRAKQGVGAGAIILEATGTAVTLNMTSFAAYGCLFSDNVSTIYRLTGGFILTSTAGTGNRNALHATRDGKIEFSGVNISTGFIQQLRASDFGSITAIGNYTVSASVASLGAGSTHWAVQGGLLRVQAHTITLTGTPDCYVWAFGADGGTLYVNSNTYTGAAAAGMIKYDLQLNATMRTNGGSASLPGGAAGVTATGGQFN